MARIVLITGGSRSGKSAFAQELAESLAEERIYIATCPVVDGEMAARIARHRRDREARSWRTIEEETALAGALGWGADTGVVLVDCLTLWINNLLYAAQQHGATLTEDDIAGKAREVLQAARSGTAGAAVDPVPPIIPAGAEPSGSAPERTAPGRVVGPETAAGPAAAPTADGGGRTVIFVTNEVGMGIVPGHPGGRLFRDLAGRCNQVFAREADAVVFMVSGIPLWIKGKDSFPSRP
ncbi:MAG TPA: bifunctional adenosylcobinamide kinase/adenosylcobinamide-phosphate guanylyltransferase [Syntrophales bacterium]|jgi:adenosylcobinamide kinase/adenosylcobinamide-phosphate guanylyltransferase|nr:bifunctional adenosylcobinamide kinase/adenosylcobinamide-phosphate guanylyltransferase [Syntrophales bacterium]HOU76949.1 bifunctional adenosylcobinamide kinase/adenosylcobinamide-phosphate guanylyltransferase [Syntrophales bacterium]HPC31718.1 bifunctional adenosylcobinamide kinase/adenosylcobinamide-phosphate guanylyltransferase [Syntrophales bacterium]HQG34934.1 bifunctional adenosylcobinamide kinase/adenosylcobinamide-phosphate guanylyltransferase [Syntrophales bacterium]HQI36026.1 bifu